MTFRGESHPIEPIAKDAFRGVDIVLSSTPGGISREWSPIAAAAGAVVVDNSSAFRMDPEVPLVVPEVNPHDIAWNKGIIANPNCSTIQMVVALKPLHDAGRVLRVVVSTYQSVSGRRDDGDSRAGDPGRRRREPAGRAASIEVRTSDHRQLHPPHRRVPLDRVHQGRDEDGA